MNRHPRNLHALTNASPPRRSSDLNSFAGRAGTQSVPTRPQIWQPPAGRDLLRDKVVLVTAAAGTGIGNATARRCLEEGATVVLSDAHQRRLGEAADELEIGRAHV